VDKPPHVADNFERREHAFGSPIDADGRPSTASDSTAAGRLGGARFRPRSDRRGPPAGLPEEFLFRGYGMDPPGSPVERPGPPDRSTPGLDDIEDLDAIMAAIELSAAAMRIYVDELRARIALARHR
jgi:hypothetical protein